MARLTTYQRFRGLILSVIAAIIFGFVAKAFQTDAEGGTLYHASLFLLVIAALSVTYFCYFIVEAYAKSLYEDYDRARDKGMTLTSLIPVFIALIIGGYWWWITWQQLGLPPYLSILAGTLAFVTVLFFPIRKALGNRLKSEFSNTRTAKIEDVKTEQITESAPSAANSKEQDKEPESIHTEAKPKTGTVAKTELHQTVSSKIVTPAGFPRELDKYPIKAIFRELVEEQILDKNWRPLATGLTQAQFALFVDMLNDCFGIKTRWKVMEDFWGMKNLRQSYNQAKKQQLDRRFYYAIKRAMQIEEVSNVKSLREWIWRYELDNGINRGV